jgi:hypothetical protein
MFDWLLLKLPNGANDLEVFVFNILWAAFAGGAAMIYGYRLRWRLKAGIYDEATRLMAGIVFVGLGTAIHRLYWAMWRAFRIHYGSASDAALWFPTHAHFVNATILVSCIGYTLHLYPVLFALHGKRWWWAACGYGLAWYISAAAFGRLIY